MKIQKYQVTFYQDELYTPFFVKAADEEQAIRRVALQLERPVQIGAKLFDVRENTVSWDDEGKGRTEIAPCLFCLSERPLIDLDYSHMFRVVCASCGASGPPDPLCDESVNQWNRAWALSGFQTKAGLKVPEKEKCPFCGGEHLCAAKDTRLYEDYIECVRCHAGGPTAETPFGKDAEKQAINKWNQAWQHLRKAQGSEIPLSLIKHQPSTNLVELEALFWALLRKKP